MEYMFEVQIEGAAVVSGKAESEDRAEMTAFALKAAFPEAFVQYQRAVPADRYKPTRWVIVHGQTAQNLT